MSGLIRWTGTGWEVLAEEDPTVVLLPETASMAALGRWAREQGVELRRVEVDA